MGLLDDIAVDVGGDHVFYDTVSGFAQSATVNGGDTITVLFETEPERYAGGDVPVTTKTVNASCRSTEKPAVNAKLTVSGVTYRVNAVEDTDDGESLLTLMRL